MLLPLSASIYTQASIVPGVVALISVNECNAADVAPLLLPEESNAAVNPGSALSGEVVWMAPLSARST
ncbi:MAG: hypothetical protein AAF404_09370, partial [Pseudomonadota bacterium]